MRELRIGEDVLASDGSRLGTVERIVVDEDAHRVTHVVVGGHLVAASHLTGDDGEDLGSDLSSAELRSLPEPHDEFVQEPGSHWLAPAGHRVEDFLRIATAIIGQGPYVPPAHVDLDLSAEHEIAPGSPLWSNGRQIGTVTEALTDDAGTLTALVIRHGLLGTHVTMPAAHIKDVIGTNVYTDLEDL
jgi:sporulation protein YlmC with PRC-barrel domain